MILPSRCCAMASLSLDAAPELFPQISYRASLEPVGDLIQLSSNDKAVCLENGRYISRLPDQRDNNNASFADRHIHEVVFSYCPDTQSAGSG